MQGVAEGDGNDNHDAALGVSLSGLSLGTRDPLPSKAQEGEISERMWRWNDNATEFLNQKCFLRPQAQSFNANTFTKEMGDIPIQTLGNLSEAFNNKNDKTVVACFAAGLNFEAVKEKVNEMTRPPEDQLNGKILNYSSETLADLETHDEITKAKDRYVQEAVHCFDSGADGDRPDDIVLVMGPSGSGKTLYALMGLPKPRAPSSRIGTPNERIVTFYCCAAKLGNEIRQKPSLFVKEVQGRIQNLLNESVNTYESTKKLDMGLRLVIDEAAVFNAQWLARVVNLQAISNNLKKVAKSVQVAFVGTGLDVITSGMSSQTEVRKYRMRPWGIKQLKEAVNHGRTELVKEQMDILVSRVSGEPVFLSLASNARAAHFLINALGFRIKWKGDIANVSNLGNAGGIVEEVVNQYIASNGLRDLSANERRRLAQNVFRAIFKASQKPGEAFFPEPREMKQAFYGMVDINVETKEGNLVFVNTNYPYSIAISEALSVVLLALLDVEGSLATTWSQFEVLCAQNELQHLVREMKEGVLQENGVKIIPLKNPFPATNARSTFQVPTMSKNTVFVNGPNAPFADVFAPNRISQCKFVSDSDKSASLDLSEFVKMGIVKVAPDGSIGEFSKDQEKQTKLKARLALNGALLSALVKGWKEDSFFEDDQDAGESKVLADADVRTTTEEKEEVPKRSPRQFYPHCQLVGKETGQRPKSIQFSYTKEDGKLTNESGIHHKDDRLHQMVEAVFYSNGRSFLINHGTGTERKAVVVEPKDVDVSGCINPKKKAEILDHLGITLREKVELRFIFARDYSSTE